MIDLLSWTARGVLSTSTLLSVGLLWLLVFTAFDNPNLCGRLRILCGQAAMLALALCVIWFLLLVAQVGEAWSALQDPFYYELLAASAASDLLLTRVSALAVLVLWSKFTTLPNALAAAAALVVVFSFSQYGHALAEPRWLRSLLLTGHLSIIAWWFAIVPVLLTQLRISRADTLQLAQRFSRQAGVALGFALSCGIAFALLHLADNGWDFQTLYAKTMLCKLALVSVILGVGALNRYRYFPRLKQDPMQAEKVLLKVLSIDGVLFFGTILLSTWLTGPASNT